MKCLGIGPKADLLPKATLGFNMAPLVEEQPLLSLNHFNIVLWFHSVSYT